MKYLTSIGILSALLLAVGCDRNQESANTEVAAQPQPVAEQETRDLSATAREGGSANNYADTNSADTSAADNTGRNVRDRDDATLTPGDQGNSESDREMTRGIRRAITANDQLSTTAKNIKIITVNGKVTLRGPVNTEEERQFIAAIVQQTGATAVDNQLEVKTNN